MLVKLIIPFLLGAIAFFVPAWFTGNREHGGPKDDERSQLIKHKAIAGSWTFMLMVFIFSYITDFFKLNTGPLNNIIFTFKHPSLFYLILLIASYFVYYLIYSKRMSGNEK